MVDILQTLHSFFWLFWTWSQDMIKAFLVWFFKLNQPLCRHVGEFSLLIINPVLVFFLLQDRFFGMSSNWQSHLGDIFHFVIVVMAKWNFFTAALMAWLPHMQFVIKDQCSMKMSKTLKTSFQECRVNGFLETAALT